ncbi:AfsR/SARP family transcriptional regulator, partial [Streptomyces sp. TRM76130]|nr:AfsR/SARP family transcriptional regulator [Streptomyces sp. TRM76130]
EERVELEISEGNHESVIGELSVWVAANPLRERLVAQLMLALYRSGAQARALTVYEQTRQTLKHELGVSPGAELQDLHRHILVSDLPPPTRRVPVLRYNNLPAGAV